MLNEDQTWQRSGDSIYGTWSEVDGKYYLNFNDPMEDKWNSGVYKGFRIFRKVKDYYECIRPAWKPTTKMIESGKTPSWPKIYGQRAR